MTQATDRPPTGPDLNQAITGAHKLANRADFEDLGDGHYRVTLWHDGMPMTGHGATPAHALARAATDLARHLGEDDAPAAADTVPDLAHLLGDLGCTVTQSEVADGPMAGQQYARITEPDGDKYAGFGDTPADALTAAAEKLAYQQARGTRHIVTIGDVRVYDGAIASLKGRTVVVFSLRPSAHLCYVRPLDALDEVFNVDDRYLADVAEQAVTR